MGAHHKPDQAEIDLYALPADYPLVRWGVMVGDCLHNLRSALDHIAWQLALDYLKREPTDNEARRIQFPIEDEFNRFKDAKVRKFISPRHFDTFGQFQPYKSGDRMDRHALGILRDLSNIDKHRVIHAAAIVPEEFRFEFSEESGVVSHGAIEIFHGTTLKEHTQIGRIPDVVVATPNPRMDAKGPFTVTVVLDDPVRPLLHGEAISVILGQLGDAVDRVVKWYAAKLTP